jgi:hypothetical protein
MRLSSKRTCIGKSRSGHQSKRRIHRCYSNDSSSPPTAKAIDINVGGMGSTLLAPIEHQAERRSLKCTCIAAGGNRSAGSTTANQTTQTRHRQPKLLTSTLVGWGRRWLRSNTKRIDDGAGGADRRQPYIADACRCDELTFKGAATATDSRRDPHAVSKRSNPAFLTLFC